MDLLMVDDVACNMMGFYFFIMLVQAVILGSPGEKRRGKRREKEKRKKKGGRKEKKIRRKKQKRNEWAQKCVACFMEGIIKKLRYVIRAAARISYGGRKRYVALMCDVTTNCQG